MPSLKSASRRTRRFWNKRLRADKTKAAHLQRGDQAEQQALDYLVRQGLKPLCSNYRCKMGELDLVMQDGKHLVVVEVRFRRNQRFGGALASITAQKQARIVAATQHYAIMQRLDVPIRFDVVTLAGDGYIYWIKNAFQVST